MLKFILIPVALIAATAGAMAQQPARSGTDQEQAACSRDVQKLCRKVIDQGDFTILACLKENRAKISKACDAVLIKNGQ